MTKENLTLLIVLICFVVFVGGLITLIVLLTKRNKKYKQFVLTNSEAIHVLDGLNKKYIFQVIKQRYDYYHRFDNKGWWSKTEPIAYLTKSIRDHLEGWFNVKTAILFNREKLAEYRNDIRLINSKLSEDICSKNGFKYKKCRKIEMNIFNSKIQDPTTDLTINVKLRYVSKQGKVDLSKSGTFHYAEIARILDSVSTKRVDKKTYEKLVVAERAMVSDSLRYDVMRRDGFRCVLCGMSAKDGAILHVDHIIPVSKGGKSEIDNLRTLCEKCNIGKSNKIE